MHGVIALIVLAFQHSMPELIIKAGSARRGASSRLGIVTVAAVANATTTNATPCDASTEELLVLADALLVMREAQRPGSSFLEQLKGLTDLAHLTVSATSDIAGAGRGLKAARALAPGTVACFYPVDVLGLDSAEPASAAPLVASLLAGTGSCRAGVLGRRRGLLSLPSSRVARALYVDADPQRERASGWGGGLVNDGAALVTGGSAIEYYAASAAARNVVMVPFGPAPLQAYVTTRAVAPGEELLATYGSEYWDDGGDGGGGGDENDDGNCGGGGGGGESPERCLADHVRDVGACQLFHTQLTSRAYPESIAACKAAFAALVDRQCQRGGRTRTPTDGICDAEFLGAMTRTGSSNRLS